MAQGELMETTFRVCLCCLYFYKVMCPRIICAEKVT